MRYLIAMLVAVAVAAVVTVFVSPLLANLAVDRFTFESPDEVGNLEDGVYMLTSLAALLVGWVIGWLVGGRTRKPSSSAGMKLLLYAMVGGALGSGARHLVNVGFGRWLGMGFPWWTFFVNVSGCLLMGVVIEVAGPEVSGLGGPAHVSSYRHSRRLYHFLGVLAGFRLPDAAS